MGTEGYSAPLFRPVTWDEVTAEAGVVRESLLAYTSLSALGCLIADALSSAMVSGAYDFPQVEYAALVLWHASRDRESAVPIRSAQVEDLSRSLKRLFFTVSRYYSSEEQRAPGNPDRADLTNRLRAAGLGIRVPAYEAHQKRVLRGLFEPFAAELKAAFGFTDEDVIACVQAIEEFAENSFRRFQQNGKVIESQRKMDEHFAKFGDYLSFDAKDLTALNAGDVATNQAILDAFSLSRGEPDDHALIPSPFSALRERPILRLGDGRFVVPNQALLFPAVQSRVETMLNPALNPRAADGLWIRYQGHRGAWVEREAERLLRAMMPGGDGVVGGYYHVKINGPIEGHVRRQVESDVTYKVDDVLFLVEGKAGSFTPATFRGGAGSISRDVKDIITRGHDQCTRTEAYVRAGNRTLENHDGTPAFVISGAIREIFRIVVTLDNAGVLATATAMMKRGGYMAGEATWTLSLTDLMILSETLRRPGELRHYARRRYESMLHEHVLIFDETDPLGVYFLHNDTTIMHGEADTVMLSGYNDSLDAYYVTGETAEPPCLEVPDEIVSLVDALAKRAAPLWSEAVCDLFALGKTLRDVAEAIAERIETDKPRDFTLGLEGGGALTVLIMPGTDPAMLLEAFISGLASSPNKPVGKRLFIGYDPASGIAQAQYRQRVDDRYFFVPPALTWISSLTNR